MYSIVEKLSFVRYGGTEGELRAANIIMDEIKAAGGSGEFMEFEIPAYTIEKYSAKITAPFEKELDVVPFGLSGNLPEGGKELKLFYAERGSADDFACADDLSDSAVLLNSFNYDCYKRLCERNAAAFILITGKDYYTYENFELNPRNLRPKLLENGKIPGFIMRANEATEIIREGAERIYLELRQREETAVSRNILATIPGTAETNDSIILTAHYDSVKIGTGSWDNASGSAAILYLYRHFLKNPPRRTLRFVWCGSEEQGLLGSRAYAEKYSDIIGSDIKFCFNFDMCGTALGNRQVSVTGGEDLKQLAAQYCREVGSSADIAVRVHSSDSAPFADRGIPSLGLSRKSDFAEIHCKHDLLFSLSAAQLEKDGEFAIGFVTRVADSVILPVGLGMPDSMKEQLDNYFLRNKTPLKSEK